MSSFILKGLYTNNSLLFICSEMASQQLFTEVTWVSALRNNKYLLKYILMKKKKRCSKGVGFSETFKLLSFIFKNLSCPSSVLKEHRTPLVH